MRRTTAIVAQYVAKRENVPKGRQERKNLPKRTKPPGRPKRRERLKERKRKPKMSHIKWEIRNLLEAFAPEAIHNPKVYDIWR